MLRLAASLRWVWTGRADVHEGERWVAKGLALGATATPHARANGHLTIAQIRFLLNDQPTSVHHFEEALRIALGAEDWYCAAFASSALAAVFAGQSAFARADELSQQAFALIDRMEDRELATAVETSTLGTAGRIAHGLGDLARADGLLAEATKRFAAMGQVRGAARSLQAAGTIAFERSEFRPALDRFLRSAAFATASGDDRVISFDLTLIAATMAELGCSVSAARLLGASASLDRLVGATDGYSDMDRGVRQRAFDLTVCQLGESAYAMEFQRGQQLSPDEAIALAREYGTP